MGKCCLNLNEKMNTLPTALWYEKVDKIFVGKEHYFIFYFISKSLMHFEKNLNITWIMIHECKILQSPDFVTDP